MQIPKIAPKRRKNGKRGTVSLTRLARRRRDRNKKTVIAPVSRTLVATWRGEGSSEVAKSWGMEDVSSTGPWSSAAAAMAADVRCWDSWVIHVLWAEQIIGEEE